MPVRGPVFYPVRVPPIRKSCEWPGPFHVFTSHQTPLGWAVRGFRKDAENREDSEQCRSQLPLASYGGRAAFRRSARTRSCLFVSLTRLPRASRPPKVVRLSSWSRLLCPVACPGEGAMWCFFDSDT